MGLGDAKLLSAIGFWFGWVSIPFVLFLSSIIALGFSLPSLVNKSKNNCQRILVQRIYQDGTNLEAILIEDNETKKKRA